MDIIYYCIYNYNHDPASKNFLIKSRLNEKILINNSVMFGAEWWKRGMIINSRYLDHFLMINANSNFGGTLILVLPSYVG